MKVASELSSGATFMALCCIAAAISAGHGCDSMQVVWV